MDTIKNHLETVNVENLMEFRKDAFLMYASARGVKLGYNAIGEFQVRKSNDIFTYNNPQEAIDKYTELVNNVPRV